MPTFFQIWCTYSIGRMWKIGVWNCKSVTKGDHGWIWGPGSMGEFVGWSVDRSVCHNFIKEWDYTSVSYQSSCSKCVATSLNVNHWLSYWLTHRMTDSFTITSWCQIIEIPKSMLSIHVLRSTCQYLVILDRVHEDEWDHDDQGDEEHAVIPKF